MKLEKRYGKYILSVSITERREIFDGFNYLMKIYADRKLYVVLDGDEV